MDLHLNFILLYFACPSLRVKGVEPISSTWKADRLPLTYTHLIDCNIFIANADGGELSDTGIIHLARTGKWNRTACTQKKEVRM